MKPALRLAVAAVLVAAALAPGAAATPAADLTSIVRDYSRDERITPCRFTRGQLEGARSQIGDDVEAYAKGIRAAIVREVRRWRRGGCAGRRGPKLRIVAIDATGAARAESVTIRNASSRTVQLRGYALRDATDHTIKLRATRLRAGRTLRIVTGCRRGHRRPVRRGSRYYACRSLEVWDDAADVVELLGPGGGLLARRRY